MSVIVKLLFWKLLHYWKAEVQSSSLELCIVKFYYDYPKCKRVKATCYWLLFVFIGCNYIKWFQIIVFASFKMSHAKFRKLCNMFESPVKFFGNSTKYRSSTSWENHNLVPFLRLNCEKYTNILRANWDKEKSRVCLIFYSTLTRVQNLLFLEALLPLIQNFYMYENDFWQVTAFVTILKSICIGFMCLEHIDIAHSLDIWQYIVIVP